MNLRLIRHFYRSALRGKRRWGAAAAASAPALIALLSTSGPNQSGRAEGLLLAVFASGVFFGLAILVVSVGVLRDERDSGTLPFVFMSPASAAGFSGSAVLAGCLASITIAFFGWTAVALVSGLRLDNWSYVLPLLLLYSMAAVGYSLVFVPLGYLFSRSLITGLVYLFVWEAMMVSALDGLSDTSIWRQSLVVFGRFADLEPIRDDLGAMPTGLVGPVVTMIVVAVVGFGLLTWAVRRRDAL